MSRHWIYPANSKIFRIVEAFHAKEILWPINSKVQIDNVSHLSFSVLKENKQKACMMGPQCLEKKPVLFDYMRKMSKK